MQRDQTPGTAYERTAQTSGPEPTYTLLPLLRELSDWLQHALPMCKLIRNHREDLNRWGVPPLFFFFSQSGEHAESESVRAVTSLQAKKSVLDSFLTKHPQVMPIWKRLDDLIGQVSEAIRNSVDARRAARVVPGLMTRLSKISEFHLGCQELHSMLLALDERVVIVLYPTQELGWRLFCNGITQLAQVKQHLNHLVARSRARSGMRLAELIHSAESEPSTFQMMLPGYSESGLDGVDHWLWGHEPLSALPCLDGVHLLLLADSPYPRHETRASEYPLKPDIRVEEVLSTGQVNEWLARIAGQPMPANRRTQAA